MLRGFHKLCDKGLWEEARSLLADQSENANTARESASEPGGYGEWTALHIACKRDPPADVVQNLCGLSEIPAETFDLYNKLPIHYAAEYGANVDVMRALIKACPQCLSGVDDEGRTPLHLSFKFSIQDPATLVDPIRDFPCLDEVEVLLGDDDAVLWTTDENDYIPLHYAVSNIDHCHLNVLEKIISTDFNTVVAQTKGGMTALHLALLKSTERAITVDIAQLLLGISPDGKEWIEEEFEGTRMLSCTEMLPLHVACQNFENVPLETLQLLLERCPSAAAAEALEGGYPLQVLESHRTIIKNKTDLDVFNKKSDLLFAYHPNILPYRTDRERLKRFEEKIVSELSVKNATLSEETKSIWTWMCMFPADADKEFVFPNIVSQILENVRDAGSKKVLACIMISKDNAEDIPLYEAVSPLVRAVLSPYLRFVDRYEMKKEGSVESESTMVIKAYDSTYSDEDERSNVVITFYSNRDEFWQEVDIHTKLKKTADQEGLNSPAIAIIQTFDLDRMGTSLETADDMKFSRDVTQYNDMYANISGYSYAIVREESGSTIDFISNHNCVDDSFGIQQKKRVRDIAESVLCLHKSNYVMGGMRVGDFVQLNGKTTKLQNVKSIVEVNMKSKLHTKFYGCVSDDFDVSNLPPEMITKLDAEGAEKYIAYWSRVSNDFNIANELTPEQVKESDKLKTYLEEEGCSFENFWSRVQNNAALWKRIQPRHIGGYYYVVKCFRAGADGGVHRQEELPYDLVPISTDLDIWFFGSLMFEIITGESLLHSNKSKNIVNDSDFERLFSWTMTDHMASRRLCEINNPLGRHLLRSLLTSLSTHRQRNMETVLKHKFFCNDEDEAVVKLSREIVLEEKEEARTYKIEQDIKLKKSTLDKRTENLSLVSPETQLRFEMSQWKLLMSTYDLSEATFPTSCIVLPYELEKSPSGNLHTPTRNIAICQKLGLIVIDILHYLSIVTDMKPRWRGQSFGHKTQEYIDKNRDSTSAPEDTLVRICEGVMRKVENATAVVADVLEGFLSSGDGETVANKLISDSLKNIVDLDVCSRVVTHAEAAQKSITLLLETIGDYPEKAAENMMNEQLRGIIGVSYTEDSFAKKESVQNTLMSIVQESAKNPLSVMEGLINSKMCELIDLYTEMDECHVYLVDEYSGLPVASDTQPLRLKFSSDIAKTLIPPTLLTMRSNFPLGIVPLLGLTLEELSEQWTKLLEFKLPYVQRNPADEINILQIKLGVDEDVGILALLEQFYEKNDPDEDFSGLTRLCSPNGIMLWATKASKEEALLQAKRGLTKLQNSKATEAVEKVTNAMKNKPPHNTGSLWCSDAPRFSNAQIPITNLPPPPINRESPVSNQGRWKSSKDFDSEKEQNIAQKNDIQQKLNKLKTWKPAQRTETSRSDDFMDRATDESVSQPMRGDNVIDYKVEQRINQGQFQGAPPTQNAHKNSNTSSTQSEELPTVPDKRQFEATVDPEPIVDTAESQRENSDGQLSTRTSEGTTVDENNDTGNMTTIELDNSPTKHRIEGDLGGGGSTNIQIESLESVKSDISDLYVQGHGWSPAESEEEEVSDWPVARAEDKPELDTSLDRNKVFRKPSTPTPKILRHGGKINLNHQVFDGRNRRDDSSTMSNARHNGNRLRPKTPMKRAPTPGGGSISSDRSRLLSNQPKTTQRLHPKKRVPFQSFDSEDNDSYFRSPGRGHFDRIRSKVNE